MKKIKILMLEDEDTFVRLLKRAGENISQERKVKFLIDSAESIEGFQGFLNVAHSYDAVILDNKVKHNGSSRFALDERLFDAVRQRFPGITIAFNTGDMSGTYDKLAQEIGAKNLHKSFNEMEDFLKVLAQA